MLLLTKNIKFKEGKLVLKFLNLFKILKYIRELIYKLELPNIYIIVFILPFIFLSLKSI
jgi:hypothetical protein